MTYGELARRLRALECELRRQSKRSHEIWTNPHNNRSAVIPNHPGDIPAGTLGAILWQLGIPRDDLNNS